MSTIAELFARDPLTHTREDVEAIIAAMRDSRHSWVTTGDKRAGAPKKLTAQDKEVDDLQISIDL